MRNRLIAKVVLASLLLLICAPVILAQKDPVVDDAWRGRVESVNVRTREIGISSLVGKADSFTGVLDEGFQAKLLDDSVKELSVSDIPLGMRVIVLYKSKNESVAGQRRKVNHIYGIVFLGRDDFDKLRAFLSLPSSTIVARSNRGLPVSNPIKAYLFVEPPRSKKDLVAWITKWNREQANTYGAIELVDNFARSDVSIVIYNTETELPNRIGEDTAINVLPSVTVFLVVRRTEGLDVLWKYTPIFSSIRGSGPTERIEKELENRMTTRGHP